MAEGLPKIKGKVMVMKFLSGEYSLLIVLFLVFSFFISINSYSMPATDFLDNCPSGQSESGCCISQDIVDNGGCTFSSGAKKVNVCHNNGTIEPSTNSIAGNTPGSHFLRCDWVVSGGQDATNTDCELACLENDGDGPGVDADCSSFQNIDTGHSTDVLGACAPGGCNVNGCDDGNLCTEDVCENDGSCSFPTVIGTIECRASTGDCDPAEECGTGTNFGDMCPSDGFALAGMLCDDSIMPSTQICEQNVCDNSGECILDSSGCGCEEDTPLKEAIQCDDGNICTVDSCDRGIECINNINTDGTICRSLAGECDEVEVCSGGQCPDDEFSLPDQLCTDFDGDDCTLAFCNGTGLCDQSIISTTPECIEPPPGGDDDDDGPTTTGDPSEEDDILETDNGEAFQLYCYYDLRDRDSFCQVTNVGPDNITLHVQVFNVGDNCIENNFNDTYTPADTHVYELSNILTNNGSPSGIDLPDDAYGFVVVTVVGGEGQEAIEGNLIGNFRVIDNSGYEYRSNAQGLNLPSEGPIETTNEYTFNFNEEGGVVLSDVVGITLDEITSSEVKATSIVDIFTKFDVSVFNNNEVIFSCRDIVFACNDQDAPLLSSLLDVSSSSVASFEYGINNAFPHSKGGPLLCPGNNITEGFVRLNLIPPFSDFDVFAGYVGLNNGNGRGSMDSFWSENFLLLPPP